MLINQHSKAQNNIFPCSLSVFLLQKSFARFLSFLLLPAFLFLFPLNYVFAVENDSRQNALIQNDLNLQRQIRQNNDIERQRNIAQIDKIAKSREYDEVDQNDLLMIQDGRCVELKQIKILESKRYSESYLKKKLLDDDKKCFSKQDLRNIRKKIENFYLEKGFSTTRVYFDSRTLIDKILTLVVVEGEVDQIIINNNSKFDNRLKYRQKTKKFAAFPFKNSGIFNLRDLEQGVDQINRLQSYNAKIDIKPDDKKGYSDIVISSQLSKPFNVGLSYDNLGQKSSGRHKKTASLNLDGLLGIYDNFYINYSKDDEPRNWQKYSKSSYMSLSIPLGYWTFAISLADSSYLTTIDDPALSYQVSGKSKTSSFAMDRVVMRNQNFKTKIGANLKIKDTKSYIKDTVNNAGTYKQTVASIFWDNTLYSRLGTINLKPSYNQGLDIFDATSDAKDITSAEAHAQFKMAKLSTYFNTSLDRIGLALPWQYKLSFDGQLSENTLYGNEKYSIGGPYSVRGFQENSIAGDNGYMVNNDLILGLNQIVPRNLKQMQFFNRSIFGGSNSINNFLSKSKLTLFYDYGYVRSKNIINATGEGYMSGAGFKFSYFGRYLNGNLTFARGINAPKFIENVYDQQRDQETIYFDLALNF